MTADEKMELDLLFQSIRMETTGQGERLQLIRDFITKQETEITDLNDGLTAAYMQGGADANEKCQDELAALRKENDRLREDTRAL